jgi:hypothetical protein
MIHLHSLVDSKIVKYVLRHIVRESGLSFPAVKIGFITNSNPEVVNRFWQLIAESYPNHPFTSVSYCKDCRLFEFHFPPGSNPYETKIFHQANSS